MDNHHVFHIWSRGAFFFCATTFLPMRPRRCAWILVAWMKIWNGELRINIQLYPVHVCKIKHPYVDGLCHPFVVNWGWWTILLYSHDSMTKWKYLNDSLHDGTAGICGMKFLISRLSLWESLLLRKMSCFMYHSGNSCFRLSHASISSRPSGSFQSGKLFSTLKVTRSGLYIYNYLTWSYMILYNYIQ